MKKLFILVLVSACLIKCGGNSSEPNPQVPITPVVPVTPVVPPADVPHEHSTGYIYKPGGLFQGGGYESPPMPTGMPIVFDWTKEGYATPVRSQGGCGSCWAFGSTQMLDGAVKIFDGKDVTLSEQELVAYDNDSYGCSGGFFAGSFLSTYGLVLDATCPYTASDNGCRGGKPKTFDAKALSFVNIGANGRAPTPEEIMAAILNKGFVAAGVAATASWDAMHGTTMTDCHGSGINHIVAIVGYNSIKKTWKMKNSWGEAWGDSGYMEVPWKCNHLADDVVAINYKPIPAYIAAGITLKGK